MGWVWSQAGLGDPTWDPTKALALRPLGKQYIVEGTRENPHAGNTAQWEGVREPGTGSPNVAVSLVKHTLMDRAARRMQLRGALTCCGL